MGWIRYQKRVKLNKNTGLNISKTGVSISTQTKHGSVGTTGYSIKTGIPRLTYRKYSKKTLGTTVVSLLLLGIWHIYKKLTSKSK